MQASCGESIFCRAYTIGGWVGWESSCQQLSSYWLCFCDDVSNQQQTEYTAARRASGVLLFIVGSFLTVVDVFRSDFEVNPIVLGMVFVVGLALYGVNIPKFPGGGT